jgi:hypothetical protein
MDLREIGWGSVEWTQLAQDRDRWRALVNTVMKFRVLAPEFYICMHTYMHAYIHTHIVKKTMVSLKAGCVDLLFSPKAGGSMSLRNVCIYLQATLLYQKTNTDIFAAVITSDFRFAGDKTVSSLSHYIFIKNVVIF